MPTIGVEWNTTRQGLSKFDLHRFTVPHQLKNMKKNVEYSGKDVWSYVGNYSSMAAPA